MGTLSYHAAYAIAAVVTVGVELIVAFAIARHVRLFAGSLRITGAVLLANAITHPALWYLPWAFFPQVLLPGSHSLYVVVGESAAILLETAVYFALLARHRPWLALALSALANAASWGAGLVLQRFLG